MGCCENNLIPTCTVIAGSTVALLARIQRVDDPYLGWLEASDVESISAQLNDMSGIEPEAVGDPETLDAEEVITSITFTDERWKKDSEGRNFLWLTSVPERNKKYEWRITITTVGGEKYVLVYEIRGR